MKAIELVRFALKLTDEGVTRLVDDMRGGDAALTQPTSRGGNHPMWVIGHLAFFEGSMAHVLLGEPNPVEHWAPLFATGSTPSSDASVYPPFDEVLATFRRLRARNLKLLDEIGDTGLDRKPANVPGGFENVFLTFGHTLLVIALHQMVHYGQIADARRVAGRAPLL